MDDIKDIEIYIPVWCYFNENIDDDLWYIDWFTFQYGAILTQGKQRYVSPAVHLHSSMVLF